MVSSVSGFSRTHLRRLFSAVLLSAASLLTRGVVGYPKTRPTYNLSQLVPSGDAGYIFWLSLRKRRELTHTERALASPLLSCHSCHKERKDEVTMDTQHF